MKMRKHYELLQRMVPENKLIQFMLAHGRDYTIGPDTYAGERGEPKQCYMNATHLAQRDPALTYVEGVVSVFGIAVEHAWCATADGIVVDPTMEPAVSDGTFDRIGEYFGVPLLTDYVIKACLRNGVYGMLDYVNAHKTMPKLVELGLEEGQRWLLDGKRRKAAR
jgi:hypothetical protein